MDDAAKERESDYNKKYYKDHKLKLRKEKKARYKEDNSYREGVRDRALKRYYATKSDTTADRTIIVSEKGRFVTIGKIGLLIKRTPGNIRTLHDKGVIPTPTMWDARGWRLYTRVQAILLYGAFRKLNSEDYTMADVSIFLKKHWRLKDAKEAKRKIH